MPLGRSESMSSMAGPKQSSYYDAELQYVVKGQLDSIEKELRELGRDTKLSKYEKNKRVDELLEQRARNKNMLEKYNADSKYREEIRKADAATQGEVEITPEVDNVRTTETKNSAMAEPANPDTKSTTSKAKGSKAEWTNWDENLSSAEYPEIPNSSKTQLADPNGLSVRTKNFLDSNVKTIEDFMALTEDKVRKSRNTSKDTWSEIQKFKEELTKDLSLVEDPKDLAMVTKENSVWKMVMSGAYAKPKNPKVKMDQTIQQLEGFIGDLDKKIAAQEVEKSKKVSLPTPKKSLAGVFKGLGRAAVAGLAEAPAYEFLNPPSAGPSDPEDPVYRFETGQMSLDEFTKRIKGEVPLRVTPPSLR